MPASPEPPRHGLVAFAGLALLLSLKADGRFPVPESLGEPLFQLLLLPYTVLFVLFAAIAADLLPLPGALARPLASISRRGFTVAAAVVFELLTLGILFLQAAKYRTFGYRLDPTAAVTVITLGIAGLVLVRQREPALLLVAAGASYAAVLLLSTFSFPLHPGRSDMLPLIVEAAGRFLDGTNPYGLYSLPHTLPLTYLPGLWLTYLPSVALGWDPRLVSLVCTTGALALAYRSADEGQREGVAALGSLFFLCPYLQYRHEIYPSPHWLALAGAVFFIRRGHAIGAGLAYGWSLATSQFSRVLFPFFFVWVRSLLGWGKAARVAALAGITALVIVAPFVLTAPAAFYAGVFGHWSSTVNVSTLNLSFFPAQTLGLPALRFVQGLVVLGLGLVAVRRSQASFDGLGFMALALLTFLLLNSLVWVYFYLTVLFLLVLRGEGLSPQAARC